MAGRARQGLRTAWKSPWTGSAARASDKASDKLILMVALPPRTGANAAVQQP